MIHSSTGRFGATKKVSSFGVKMVFEKFNYEMVEQLLETVQQCDTESLEVVGLFLGVGKNSTFFLVRFFAIVPFFSQPFNENIKFLKNSDFT